MRPIIYYAVSFFTFRYAPFRRLLKRLALCHIVRNLQPRLYRPTVRSEERQDYASKQSTQYSAESVSTLMSRSNESRHSTSVVVLVVYYNIKCDWSTADRDHALDHAH